MIKKNINFTDFCDSFSDSYKNSFTYDGKRALFDYLEALSENMRQDIELDIIDLCCSYTEYKSLEELQANYSDVKDFEDLSNHTIVIPVENAMKTDSFIIQNY